MTRAETSDLMALIAEEHPKFLASPNPERRLNLWAEAFANVPYDLVDFAVRRMLIESPYAPKLSDVVQRIKELTRQDGDNAVDAWNLLNKAISGAVSTQKEFEALPPELQRFCGSLSGLRSMGMMKEDVVNSVTRGQFMKVYDGMRRSRETMELMPPQLRELAQSIAKPLPKAAEGQTNPPRKKAIADIEAPAAPAPAPPPQSVDEYIPLSEQEFERRRQDMISKVLGTQGKDGKL